MCAALLLTCLLASATQCPCLGSFCMLLVVRNQKLQAQVGADDHDEGDCGADGWWLRFAVAMAAAMVRGPFYWGLRWGW